MLSMQLRRLMPLSMLLIGGLALPTTSGAITVRAGSESVVRPNNDYGEQIWTIHIEAAPGEANRIESRNTVVKDFGASIQMGVGCMALNERAVACPPPGPTEVRVVVDTGDGDDSALIYSDWCEVNLGSGDDRVNAACALASIRGGEGLDDLNSSGAAPVGSTTLTGGPGNDTLSGNGQTTKLVGGPGHDRMSWGVVSYADHRSAVKAELTPRGGTGGASGERDRFGYGVTDIEGGAGDDTLIGNASDNVLIGNGGSDRLIGGPGNDSLYGDISHTIPPTTPKLQADAVDGGPGSDTLTTGAGGRALGGPGADTIRINPGATAIGGAGADSVTLEIPYAPSRSQTRIDLRDGARRDDFRCIRGDRRDRARLGSVLIQLDQGEKRPRRTCGLDAAVER